MGITFTPSFLRMSAVPPVEIISTPVAASPFTNSATPFLSVTLTIARWIFFMTNRLSLREVHVFHEAFFKKPAAGKRRVFRLCCYLFGLSRGFIRYKSHLRPFERRVSGYLRFFIPFPVEEADCFERGFFDVASERPGHEHLFDLIRRNPGSFENNLHARPYRGLRHLKGPYVVLRYRNLGFCPLKDNETIASRAFLN